MADRRRVGRGSSLGCVLTLLVAGALAYRFGPTVLLRLGLRGSLHAPIDWGKAHEEDGLRVSVVSAAFETTEIEDLLGSRDGSADLHVTLEVTNLNAEKPIRYRTPRLLRASEPTLADDSGREVPPAAYGDETRIEGQLASGTEIAPRSSETHLLLFREPSKDAREFVLTLDLGMFGHRGTARFRIPADRVAGLR
jgi:hypothetical protein